MEEETLIELIQKEIEWCKTDKSSTTTKEFKDGFIKGLLQTLSLIECLANNIKSE